MSAATVLLLVAQFAFSPQKPTALPAIAVILLLTANSWLMLRMVNSFSTGFNLAAPLLFASVLLSDPGFLTFGTGLVAALLLNVALYLAMQFVCQESKNDIIFFSTMFAGAASLLFPPLFWTLAVLFAISHSSAIDKLRHTAMALSGFILPLLLFAGYLFISEGLRESLNVMGAYFSECFTPHLGFSHTNAAKAIKVAILAIIFAAAVLSHLKHFTTYSVTHFRAMTMLGTYTIMLTTLMLLFPPGNMQLCTSALMLPATIVIYDHLTSSGQDRSRRISFCFMLLALSVEFLSLLLLG